MSDAECERLADEKFNECYSSFRDMYPPCKFAKTIFQIKVLLNSFDFVDETDRLKLLDDINYFVARLKLQIEKESKNSD